MTHTLTIHILRQLSKLADAVYAGQPITRELADGVLVTGVARAFTRNGGDFLGPGEDVRDAYVWVSGTTEHFWPVVELLDGLENRTVALNYRP